MSICSRPNGIVYENWPSHWEVMNHSDSLRRPSGLHTLGIQWLIRTANLQCYIKFDVIISFGKQCSWISAAWMHVYVVCSIICQIYRETCLRYCRHTPSPTSPPSKSALIVTFGVRHKCNFFPTFIVSADNYDAKVRQRSDGGVQVSGSSVFPKRFAVTQTITFNYTCRCVCIGVIATSNAAWVCLLAISFWSHLSNDQEASDLPAAGCCLSNMHVMSNCIPTST